MDPVKTGDIVLFRSSSGDPKDAVQIPAIVLITHEDWKPGYHDASGTWVPNSTISQPLPGTVHLQAFTVPSIPVGATQPIAALAGQVHASIKEGDAVGQFARR